MKRLNLLPILLLLLLMPAAKLQAQTSCSAGLGESSTNPFLIPDTATFYAFARCMSQSSWSYYDCEDSVFTTTDPALLGHNRVRIPAGGADMYFKLTADLVLNLGDIAGSNGVNNGYGGEPWRVWTPMTTFDGHFDGGYHTISGLFLPSEDSTVALFRGVSGDHGCVENLGLTNAYISGTKYVGGIASSVLGHGVIRHCFFEGSLYATDNRCGGITAYTEENARVTECYATGSAYSTADFVGGIVGVNRATVSNCYSSMFVSNDAGGSIGGVYGNNEDTVNNCYYDKQMTDYPNADATSDLTVNMTMSSFAGLGSAFVPQDGYYPYLAGFDFDHNPDVRLSVLPLFFYAESTTQYETAASLMHNFAVGTEAEAVWSVTSWNNCATVDNTTDTVSLCKQGIADLVVSLGGHTRTYIFISNIAPFLGAEKNPFTIDNLTDLTNFRNGINSGLDFTYKRWRIYKGNLENTHWLQTADIDLASVTNWNPVGETSDYPFTGYYHGGDNAIMNLKITGGSYKGLFGYVSNASISHLKIRGVDIKSVGDHSGVLCGHLQNSSVDSCSSEGGTVTSSGRGLGLVGAVETGTAVIRHCYNTCDFKGSAVGGIVGRGIGDITLTIEDCWNSGNINGGSCGGILGVTSEYSSIGTATVYIRFCRNSGNISVGSNIGGILGFAKNGSKGEISYCINTGSITSISTTNVEHYAGGICGIIYNASLPINYCINTGDVTSTYNFGGISSYGAHAHYSVNAGNVRIKYYNGDGKAVYGLAPNAYNSYNIASVEGVRTSPKPCSDNSESTIFYNKQFCVDAPNQASYGRTTSDMIGTASVMKDALGEDWLYEEGMYPRPKWTDTIPWAREIAITACTPVLLSDHDKDADNVTEKFQIFGCDSGITWKVMEPETPGLGGRLFHDFAVGSTITGSCVNNAISPALNNVCIGPTVIGAYIHDTVLVKRVILRHYVAPHDTLCIDTEEDLIALRDSLHTGEAFYYRDTALVPRFADSTCFKLCNDITLTASDWIPIGSNLYSYFNGIFLGDGDTISNLNCASTKGFAGLFGWVKGRVHDLNIKEVNITGGKFKGSVAAQLTGGRISNCTAVSGTITGGDYYAGGIVGLCEGNAIVSYCTNDMTLRPTANAKNHGEVGGVVGTGGLVSHCVNRGEVYVSDNFNTVGGVAGNSTVEDCYNMGKVTVTGNSNNCLGGVLGYGNVSRSYNTGEISGAGSCAYIGGVSGNGNVNRCYNVGQVTAMAGTPDASNYVGGIAGNGTVEYSYNSAIVNGANRKYVGGITGAGAAKWCYNSNTVRGTGTYVGSISGENNSRTTKCVYDKQLSVVGGLAGADVTDKATGFLTEPMLRNGLSGKINLAGDTVWLFSEGLLYPQIKCLAGTDPSISSVMPVSLNVTSSSNYDVWNKVTGSSFLMHGCEQGDWEILQGDYIATLDSTPAVCSGTITGIGILKLGASVNDSVYRQVRLLVGLDNPLRIKNVTELENFRYVINSNLGYYDFQNEVFKTALNHEDSLRIEYFMEIEEGGLDLSFKLIPDAATVEAGCYDLSDIPNWVPVGDYTTDISWMFQGTFLGNGQTIKGLKITSTDDRQGLFGRTSRAVVRDLTITNAKVDGSGESRGVLVGVAANGSLIDNCVLYNDTLTGTGRYAGGICGCLKEYSTLKNCSADYCEVNGTGEQTGGIVGRMEYSTVNNCLNDHLSMSGSGTYKGGVVGYSKRSNIYNSTLQNSDINVDGENVGGIVGRVDLADYAKGWNQVKNCASINNNIYVNANYVGGIVGSQQGGGNYGQIQECHSTGGSIISTKNYAGGIIGHLTRMDGGFKNNYNNTPIQAQNYAGGIAGGCSYGDEITKCYNFANVTATSNYAGGITGALLRQDAGAWINYCYNAGDILATSCAGGICGSIMVNQVRSRGITFCLNVGNVTAKGARAGGIVGISELSSSGSSYHLGGHVRNSFNAGIVTAVTQAGGILGCSGVPIDNSAVGFTNNVNIGWVEATSMAGAICGYTPDTKLLSNNYYDLQMSRCKGVSDADVPGTIGKLTTEMLGDNLRSSLQDTYWAYAEGMYPRIKELAAADAAIAAATPVLLPVAVDTICASDVPKGDFNNALAGCDTVSWVRTEGYGLSITGCDFTVTGRNYVLIADRIDGDTLKEVQLALGISEKNPLDIVNLEQLKRFRDYINSNVIFYYNPVDQTFVSDDATSGEHYVKIEPGGARMFFRLNFEDGSNTVDLSLESGDWIPIGGSSNRFKGHFNGNNHTVTGMSISGGSKDYQGFFGYLQGIVKNLSMAEVNLTCAGNNHGAIAGYNLGTITNSSVLSGSVKGTDYVGGLSGYNYFSQMSDCYNGADVTGRQYVGGITGCCEQQGFITRCFNYGMITSTGLSDISYAGGITGYTTEDVTYCYNTGTVNGKRRMAGVVGWSQTRNLNYCYNAGYVNSTYTSITNIYVGSVAASDNAVYQPNYSYYDHQMSPNFEGIGLAGGSQNSSYPHRVIELLTANMTGETSAMRSVLGDTYWTYAEGEYPRLRSLADEPGSDVSVKAVYPQENMVIDHIGLPLTASLGDSVEWQRYGNGRALNMTQASLGQLGLTICGPDTLSVALAQTHRLVPLNVVELAAVTLVDTACDGFYLWQATGRVYTQSISDRILMAVAEGCDSVLRLELTIPPALKIDLDVHHRACFGDTVDYAEATVSGGFEQGYLYCWTRVGVDTVVSRTNRIENCGPGDYILSVRDAVHPDCEKSVPVTITEPLPLQLSLVEADNHCYGENDGIIVVSYSGGLPDYTLSYTGTASATKTVSLSSTADTLRNDFDNGSYTVTITDKNNCSVSLEPIVFIDSTDEYNIMPVSVSKVYDGVEVNVAQYELTIGGGSPVLVNSGADYQLPNGDTLNVTLEQTGMVKDVVDTTNSIVTYSIRNKDDKTCRYHITGPGSTVPVIITPRNITFRSADSVVTCGSGTDNPDCSVVELTNHRLIIGGDGFVAGEGVTPTFTGVQHGVGMSPNGYDYSWNSGTNPSNYTVLSQDTGILVVTSDVLIMTNTDSKMYDGTNLLNPGYQVYGLASEDTLLVDLTTPFLLDAGTVPNDFTNMRIVLKSDMTTPSPRTYSTIDTSLGTMTVTRRNVTISTGSLTHEYDGNTYSNPEVTVSGDGFAAGEEPVITVSKTITNVGTEENSYVIVTPLPYKPDNYNITAAPGTLEITARPLDIVGGSATVPYNGIEQSVTTYTASLLSGHTLSGVSYDATGTAPGTYDGVFSNTVGDVVVKDAGLNDVTANYAITQTPGTLTINANDLPLVIISESYDNFKYNGQPHSYMHYKVTYNNTVVTEVLNDTIFVLPTGDTLTIHPVDEGRGVIDVNRDASDNVVSYQNKYTYDLENTICYTNIDAQFGTLTVNPRLLVLKSPSYHVVYTGSRVPSEQTDNVERTGEGLATGQSVSCTMLNYRTDVGSTPNDFSVSAGAHTNLSNYDVQKILGNIIISPAKLTIAAVDKSRYYGEANPELTYTITGFVPGEGLVGSGAARELHYENDSLPRLSTTATQYSNVGNYPIMVNITNVRVVDTGGVCNYELEANDATLRVLRRALEITANSKTDIVYDGMEHSYRETGWPYYTFSGDFMAGDTVTRVHLDGSRVVAGTTAIIPSGAEVKHYEIVAPGDTNWTDVTQNYEITYNNGALTIAPVDITITPRSYTHDFTGDTYSWEDTEAPHYEITSGALVAHDSIVLIGLSGSGVAAGTYDITIVPGSILIVDTNEVHGDYSNVDSRYDMTGGYNITLETGTLTINHRSSHYEITMQAKSGTKIYDGTNSMPDSVNGFVQTEFEFDGFTYTVEGLSTYMGADAINVGSWDVNVNGTAVVRDANGIDVTSEFTVITQKGTLTIEQRPITLTASSVTHEYDGLEYTAASAGVPFTLTSGSLCSGHFVNATVSGALTYPGTEITEIVPSSVQITNTTTENVTANYAITYVPGTITITDRTTPYVLTLQAKSDTIDYDANAHTLTGFDTLRFTIYAGASHLPVIYHIDPTTVQATTIAATDLGDYPNTASFTGTYLKESVAYAKVLDANDTDVTSQFNVTLLDGNLRIKAREATITVSAASKKYGDADPVFTGTVDGLLNATDLGTISYSRTNSDEDADTYDDVLTASYTPNANYVVTVVPGDFTIDKRTVILTSETATKPYDGTPLTKPVVSVTGDGIFNNEIYNIVATGSVTDIAEGAVTNTITYETQGAYNDNNYVITKNEGTLQILGTDENIEITSADGHWIYDGNEHSNDTYSVTFGGVPLTAASGSNGLKFELQNGDTLRITPDASRLITNVGYTDNTFTYTIDNDGYYVGTKIVNIGRLTVDPDTVTVDIVGHTAEYNFTGSAQTVHGYDKSYSTTLYPYDGNITFTGDSTITETAVGSYTMGLAAGQFENNNSNYYVTFNVTDGWMVIYDSLDVAIVATDVVCHKENNGMATITVSGGRPATTRYSYVVTGTSHSADDATGNTNDVVSLTDLDPDTYSVTITDTLGYTVTRSFVIDEPDTLVVSALTVPTTATGLCPNQANYPVSMETTGGNGMNTITWSGDADNASATSTNTTSETVVNKSGTNDCGHKYSVTVTVLDKLNCSASRTDTFTVVDTEAPDFTVPADTALCRNAAGEIEAPVSVTQMPTNLSDNCTTAEADFTVVWTDLDTLPANDLVPRVIRRKWTVTDLCNRSTEKIQNITINPQVVMNTPANQTICSDSSIAAIVFGTTMTDGTMSYAWTRKNTTGITGLAASGTDNIAVTALKNTTTTVQIDTFTVTPTYDNNGISCTGAPVTFQITVNPEVLLTLTNMTQNIVFGDEIDTVVVDHSSHANLSYSVPTGVGLTYNPTTKKLYGIPNAEGTYTVTFTATSTQDPNCGQKQEVVTINVSKKVLKITLDTTKLYDGTVFVSDYTASTDGYTIEGLVTGDYITAGAVTSSADTVYIYTGNGTTDTAAKITTAFATNNGISNYDVVYVFSQKIVKNNLPVVITSGDKEFDYDGAAHSYPSYTVTYNGVNVARMATDSTKFELPTGDVLSVINPASITYYSENTPDNNTFSYTIVNESNYDASAVSMVNGTISINAMSQALRIESKGYTWTYDGNAHDYKHYRVTFGSDTITAANIINDTVFVLPTHDTLTISNAPSITDAGKLANTFTYTLQHDILYVGTRDTVIDTLRVTPLTGVEVIVKEHGGETTYDGYEQHVSGYDLISISNSLYTAADFHYSGAEADSIAKGRYVGAYQMNILPGDFTNDNSNFDAIIFTIQNDSLVIKPNPTEITITAGSAEKLYDGTPLVDSSFTYTPADVFAQGDTLVVTIEGSITEVGQTDNVVTGYRVYRNESLNSLMTKSLSAPTGYTKDVTDCYTFASEMVKGTLKIYGELNLTVDSVSEPLCPGVNEGVVIIRVEGGKPATPRYNYEIVGNVTHGIFTGTSDSIIMLLNLEPDTYNVLVKDDLDSSATITFEIKEREVLTDANSKLLITTVIEDTIRHGGCDLKIMDIGTPILQTNTSLPSSEITISNNAPADSIYPVGTTIVRWVAKSLCGDSVFIDQFIKVSFQKCPEAVDYEDTIYPSVRLGRGCKCWTTKDLKSTKYSDGRSIDNVMSYYSREFPNTEENVRIFGHLYDWYASADTGRYGSVDSIERACNLGHRIQGICPAGWYLPSDEDFEELNMYPTTDLRSTNYWITANGVVNTNATGFNSLPGGRYNCPLNRYEDMMGMAYYWTCHPVYDLATGAMIDYICEKIVLYKDSPCNGHSVRCIYDEH